MSSNIMIHMTDGKVSCDLRDSYESGATLKLVCIHPVGAVDGKNYGGNVDELTFFLTDEQLELLLAQLSGKYYVRKAKKAQVADDKT